jgi:FKBP-type peptidyl-prolyl cis-trans isomerase FkpA
MKKVFCLAGLSAIMMMGCKDSFIKTTGGIEYKIISDNTGAKLADGNFIELRLRQEYKDASIDTVLLDAKDAGSEIFPFSSQIPAPYYKIFAQLRNGDSVVLKMITDTLIKQGRSLPFMKKDQYIVTSFKVLNIFTTKEQADSASAINNKIVKEKRYQQTLEKIKTQLATTDAEQMKTDDAILKDYMTKNNIVATKSDLGVYVSLTDPGTGDNLDKNSIAEIKYTGKTLDDSVFDSNIDPKFGHTDALDVDMGEFRMIPGWIDGLKLMKKGSKGLLLIPSSLAYGKTGQMPRIKPNANLVFNVEVVDVITVEQMQAQRMEKQKRMMAERQHYMDSVQKAKSDTLKSK